MGEVWNARWPIGLGEVWNARWPIGLVGPRGEVVAPPSGRVWSAPLPSNRARNVVIVVDGALG
jgi:hypothetical protein